MTQSSANLSPEEIPCFAGICREERVFWGDVAKKELENEQYFKRLATKFPRQWSREFYWGEQGISQAMQGILQLEQGISWSQHVLKPSRFEGRLQ